MGCPPVPRRAAAAADAYRCCMATVHRELETTYDAAPGWDVPNLLELAQAARDRDLVLAAGAAHWSQGPPVEQHLSATYVDTEDLDLWSASVALRRRTGGADEGWHLKAPATGGARCEVSVPIDAQGRARASDGSAPLEPVPAELVEMTSALTAGGELVPVARIDTDRTVRRLLDPSGRVLVELADDRVTARRLRPLDGPGQALGAERTWREIEVELVDGPAELLELADTVLRARGLTPADAPSKLARVLGPRPDESRAAGTTAGDVVLAHVHAQVARVCAEDLRVRLAVPDAVHAMRVATRRLRSALTTFVPLFRAGTVGPLRTELRWLARILGEARDAQVLRDRVTTALAVEPDEAVLAATVPAEVTDQLDERLRSAHEEVLAQLTSERYRSLVRALRTLLAAPPLKKRASRPARDALPRLVAASDADVRSAIRRLRHATDPRDAHTLRHDARKAAKRARYAAEAVTGVLGEEADAYARAMERVQESFGEHLDAVEARARLRDLGASTGSVPTAFTYGRLHALEDAHVEQTRSRADAAWTAARTKRLRRWLR